MNQIIELRLMRTRAGARVLFSLRPSKRTLSRGIVRTSVADVADTYKAASHLLVLTSAKARYGKYVLYGLLKALNSVT